VIFLERCFGIIKVELNDTFLALMLMTDCEKRILLEYKLVLQNYESAFKLNLKNKNPEYMSLN